MPITRAYGQASQLGNTPAASNPVINGAFDIWQRGTSGLGAGAYTADRWYFDSGSGRTVSRQTTGDTTNLPNIQYCARVQRTAANTSTTLLAIAQSFETVNSIPYVGKTVTLSFYARKGSDYSAASSILTAYVVSGTGTDQNQRVSYTGQALPIQQNATLTTTWQRFSYSGTISSSATEITVNFDFTPVGTAGTNDYFEITGVQLDLGSVALPFRRSGNTLAGELAACQRYYYLAVSGTDKIVCSGYYVSATQVNMFIPFPVTMRTAPTLVATSGTDYYFIEGNGSNDAFNGLTIYRPTQNAAQMYVNSNVSGTAGYAGNIQTNNASASVAFNSEL